MTAAVDLVSFDGTESCTAAVATPDRYRELRTWYARDRGRTTLDEVVTMIESAASRLPTRLPDPT